MPSNQPGVSGNRRQPLASSSSNVCSQGYGREVAVSRATRHEFLPGLSLLTCSAEDLVVLKTFANRPRDWADVETIIIRQQARLDWRYVYEQLEPLIQVKDAPEIVDRLRPLRTNHLEQMHREGYKRKSPQEGEFDTWEKEQTWPEP